VREYIALDSTQNAAVVAGRIIAAAERLRLFPKMGRASEKRGMRELIIPRTPYILIYTESGNTIRILAVFHAKQAWERIL
jgi:plasmid stabilization system protein ParE